MYMYAKKAFIKTLNIPFKNLGKKSKILLAVVYNLIVIIILKCILFVFYEIFIFVNDLVLA